MVCCQILHTYGGYYTFVFVVHFLYLTYMATDSLDLYDQLTFWLKPEWFIAILVALMQ